MEILLDLLVPAEDPAVVAVTATTTLSVLEALAPPDRGTVAVTVSLLALALVEEAEVLPLPAVTAIRHKGDRVVMVSSGSMEIFMPVVAPAASMMPTLDPEDLVEAEWAFGMELLGHH
jgi:hypothetical protein